MKLTRKKIKPGSYQLVDQETGKVIAQAHLTGTYLDNYPWTWYLDGEVYFGNTSVADTGSTESLKSAIDLIQARVTAYGIYYW